MGSEDLWRDDIDVFAEEDALSRQEEEEMQRPLLGLMLRKNLAWPQLQ